VICAHPSSTIRSLLGILWVVRVNRDWMKLPLFFPLHPARSNSPCFTFNTAVFEYFVFCIGVTVPVIPIKNEFAEFIYDKRTFQQGFCRYRTRCPDVLRILLFLPRQPVNENSFLFWPQVIPQVALVLPVHRIVDLSGGNNILVRHLLPRFQFSMVFIHIDGVLVISSSFESSFEGIYVSKLRIHQIVF